MSPSTSSDPKPTKPKIFQGPQYRITQEIQAKLSEDAGPESLQIRRGRRRRLSRRSLLFARLRSLTARVWSRFPLFHSSPPPALPARKPQLSAFVPEAVPESAPESVQESTSESSGERQNGEASVDAIAKIFSRPKKRKGRPEGTKGAGSRSV